NRQRDARAAHLDHMHVAVDPGGSARLVGVLSDLEEPQVAACDALADALHADEAGIRLRPVVDDAGDLFVLEVIGAKGAHAEFGVRAVIIWRPELSLQEEPTSA